MTDATNVGNPLQDDPDLRRLLDELDTISTRRSFQRWRASFLSKLDEYVSVENRAPAQVCYETFSQSVGKLSALVKKLYLLLQQGQLTVDRTTVRARKCLSDLQGQLDIVLNNMAGMLPATTEQEKQLGFTKFHLGAVLVQDGFCEYDRLVICDEILHHMKQTSVHDVCDRQLLQKMENYHDRLGMFCDVMADLQLYKVMVKCRELILLQDEEEKSSINDGEDEIEEDEGLQEKRDETGSPSESDSESSKSSDSSVSTADNTVPCATPKKVKEAEMPVAGPTRFVVQVGQRRHSMASIPVVHPGTGDMTVQKNPAQNDDKVNEKATTSSGHDLSITTKKKGSQEISSKDRQPLKMSRRHSTLGSDRPLASENFDSSYSMNPYFAGKNWNEWEDHGDSKIPRFSSFRNYYHGSHNPESWRIGAALRNANNEKEARSREEADLLTKPMLHQDIKEKLNHSCPQLQSEVILEDEGTETVCDKYELHSSGSTPSKSADESERVRWESVEALGMESAHGTVVARLDGSNASDDESSDSEVESDSFDSIVESVYPDNKDWGSVLGPLGKDGCPKSFRGLSDESMHRSTEMVVHRGNKQLKKIGDIVPSFFQKRAAGKKNSRGETATLAKKDRQQAKESKPKSLKSKFSQMFNKGEYPAFPQENSNYNAKTAKKKGPSWSNPSKWKRPLQSPVNDSNELSPPLHTSSEENLALATPKGQLPETSYANILTPQMPAEHDKKSKKPKVAATKTSKLSDTPAKTNNKSPSKDVSAIKVSANNISNNPAVAEDQLDLFNCVSNSVALGKRAAMPPERSSDSTTSIPSTSPTKKNGGLLKRLSSGPLKTEPKQNSRPIKQTSCSKLPHLPAAESTSKASPRPSQDSCTVSSPKDALPAEAFHSASRASETDNDSQRQDVGPPPENVAEQISLGGAFGYAVSVSSDGTVYASGAPRHAENKGRVSVLTYRGNDKDEDEGEWTPLGQTLGGKGKGDFFGAAVGISGDGLVLAVGSPQLSQKNQAGYVRVYRYQEDDNYWAPMGDVIRGKQPGESFGWSLSLSSDGQQVVVGGPQHAQQHGVVRVYRFQKDCRRWVQTGRDVRGESAGASVAMTHNGQMAASSSPDAKIPRAFSVQQ